MRTTFSVLLALTSVMSVASQQLRLRDVPRQQSKWHRSLHNDIPTVYESTTTFKFDEDSFSVTSASDEEIQAAVTEITNAMVGKVIKNVGTFTCDFTMQSFPFLSIASKDADTNEVAVNIDWNGTLYGWCRTEQVQQAALEKRKFWDLVDDIQDESDGQYITALKGMRYNCANRDPSPGCPVNRVGDAFGSFFVVPISFIVYAVDFIPLVDISCLFE